MIFRNLTMAGFKSFAEKVEIDIDPGLTGIVGPNGCGKSNIVEAMRWIMGESSARQMRGTEMDDIIFAGTENRPARNLAEILLKLDNSNRTAPADFNNADELEIIRKVQRGKGSSYLINGRPARAKDVQLLFADTASGARSAGIVSQGRIGAIVGAKPEDRRSLIEEAANIKGLHQRKRDAELKLRGTETNLERLDDIIQQLSEQRAQLAKQARQAARYRSVADRIRTAEAQLLRARWYIARAASDEAKKRDSVCRQEIETATRNNAAIAIQLATAAATLPALRDAEAAQAAEVQKFILTLRDYERELAQIASTQQRLTSQLAQIDADAVREDTLHGDASTALDGLADELKAQEEAVSLNGPRLDDARQALEAARSKSAAADTAAATLRAKRLAVQAARESKRAQDTQLAERIARTETDLAGLNISQRETEGYEASERRDDAERAARDANTAFDACEAALNAADIAREEDLTRFRDADAIVTRLTAELDALSYLLSESDSQIGTPMSDLVAVSDRMELALSLCFAGELSLSYTPSDKGFWRDGFTASQMTAPKVGTPLSQFVSGNETLLRAISGVAVVDDHDGASLQNQLAPGQALVSRDGTLWRWDGLVKTAQAASDAERIRQRQRVQELTEELGATTTTRTTTENALQSSEDLCRQTRGERASLLEAVKRLQNEETDARRRAEQAVAALQNARTREVDLQQIRSDALQDRTALMGEVQTDDDISALDQQLEDCENTARACRGALDSAASSEAELAQAIHTATARKIDIARQQQDWQTRLSQTAQRRSEMTARRTAAQQEMDTLSQRPALIKGEQDKVTTLQEAAEISRQEKADALRSAEEKTQTLTTSQRESERLLSTARETGIRAEGAREKCEADLEVIRDRIAEKLNCAPAQLDEIAGLKEGASEEPIDTLEARVTRLHNERDQIGPVNLRAEIEMAEIDSRVTEMQTEKDDLIEAVAKLRSAIATLNKEGRTRLLASFNDVNKYFTELFKTLFGGGHAELRLTESDDPLLAGIEILASPPGKKMQSLSLLSGGEQALTALAIIFAVFLTNPAPICILDEVDAPLDDSNVARFCDLLRDIAQRTQTRFLVVTHHRMTMARMDRLFGVTMEQKGISRLVSVDLQTAEEMRDPVMGQA